MSADAVGGGVLARGTAPDTDQVGIRNPGSPVIPAGIGKRLIRQPRPPAAPWPWPDRTLQPDPSVPPTPQVQLSDRSDRLQWALPPEVQSGELAQIPTSSGDGW